MAAGLPPDPPLDPTVSPGQSGHIDDHEVIAGTLAMLREAAGMTVAEIGTDLAAAGAVADALALKADTADLGTAAAMTPTQVVEDAGAQASLSGAFAGSGPPLGTGIYYGTPAMSLNTTALAAGTLSVTPFWLPRATSFDRISAEVTSGVAASTVRLGVYASSSTDAIPDALVLDAGTIDGNTVGHGAITIDLDLAAGLYWLGAVSQGGAPTLRAVFSSPSPWAPHDASEFLRAGFTRFSVPAALPASFGATMTIARNIPRVLLRAA